MKRMTQVLVTAVLIAGCNVLGIKSHRNINPEQSLILTDTTGQKATVYHSGESFVATYRLINTTNREITYYDGIVPSVSFEIWQNDSLVTTSGYGIMNIFISSPDTLAPGDTLQGRWWAPDATSIGQSITLNPGTYQLKVTGPDFQNGIKMISPVSFSITK